MSKKHQERIMCPRCREVDLVHIWDEIDADEEAELAVLDGELFLFRCPKCNFLTTMNYNTVYRDRYRKATIMCISDEVAAAEEADALKNAFKDEGVENVLGAVRFVKNTDELCEKAQIFFRNLDDRVVEIIKWIARQEDTGQSGITTYEKICFFWDRVGDDRWLLFRCETPFDRRVSQTYYEYVESRFEQELANCPPEMVIDAAWAEQFMAKYPTATSWFFDKDAP